MEKHDWQVAASRGTMHIAQENSMREQTRRAKREVGQDEKKLSTWRIGPIQDH